MKYIDLDFCELRRFMTAGAIAAETSKRRAVVKYAIQFVRDAVVIELLAQTSGLLTIGQSYAISTFVAGDDFTNVGAASNTSGTSFVATGTTPSTWTHASALDSIILGFKAPAGYDSVAYVLGPFIAAKTGTGEDTVYTFTIEFLNAQLDQLLANNLDEVTLLPEIRWTSTNENGETLAFDWVVQNNVIRGGESVTSYPVTAIAITLPEITKLVGGDGCLDGQLLAGFPDNTIFEVVTDLGDGILGESRWQKRPGDETVSDVAAGVIVCTDFFTRLYRVAG